MGSPQYPNQPGGPFGLPPQQDGFGAPPPQNDGFGAPPPQPGSQQPPPGGYGLPAQYGPPGGFPPPPPQSGRSKKGWWIGGGVVVVVLAAIVAVALVVFVFAGGDKGTPTTSAAELVLPEADFPELDGGEFTFDTGSADTGDAEDFTVDNAACQDLFESTDTGDVDSASRDLDAGDSSGTGIEEESYSASVRKEIDLDYTDNFDDLLAECAEFTLTFGNGAIKLPMEITVESLTLPGIDGDYNGARLTGTIESPFLDITLVSSLLLGTERGVSFNVDYTHTTSGSADIDEASDEALVAMFNAQRSRIEAAE